MHSKVSMPMPKTRIVIHSVVFWPRESCMQVSYVTLLHKLNYISWHGIRVGTRHTLSFLHHILVPQTYICRSSSSVDLYMKVTLYL